MTTLSFVGKTAIITGAGGALGRAYAFDLAKRGCDLLINDVFATLSGTAQQKAEVENAAEKLTYDLQKFGIKAVYNTDSVANGEKIVEAALKQFGRCDILINNAGNLRDKSFAKLTVEEWESVIGVHLHGTFKVSHAVWPVMQQQNYGRIINIGSGAGLYGNFGQANYSSAKMGILGLTNTLAKEGEKHNITVNCVVPVAGSRMTETVLSADMLKELKAEHVAPIVTYLAHDSSKVTGTCFEVGGGWYSQVRLQRSAGRYLASDESTVTAEAIQSNIDQIRDFKDNTYPFSPADAFRALILAKENKSSPTPEKTPDATLPVEPTKEVETKKVSEIVSQSDFVFDHLKTYLSQVKPEDLSKVRTKIIYEIKIDNNTKKYWLINTKYPELPPVALVNADDVEKLQPHAVLKCDEKTLIGLAEGKLSPEFSYMKGSLKITGNLNSALKLKTILENARKHLNL